MEKSLLAIVSFFTSTKKVPAVSENKTISDLVLFLGFNDRKRFFAYEAHPLFGDSIKKARVMIEREYEMLLRTNCGGGPIFALKNFGWIDKHEIEHSGEIKFINHIPEPEIVRDAISAN